jgi:predicted nucleic acid-binding Zn ribbon protein
MKKKRSRNSEYIHIKEVLSSVIRTCRKESNTVLSEIRKTWNAELDKVITDHAQPTALKGSILLVTVKSSTLSHQLRYLTNDILNVINRGAENYRISELKIKTGNF